MKICGVIAEYNPFHNGHALHLTGTRAILGPDTAIVCIMSGNVVQRGDLAIQDKYTRAQAAVLCGADLVLELPLGAALSSAEGFAEGAVGALDALGLVQYLSFGSECGSARELMEAAAAMQALAARGAIRPYLQDGLSYAAAWQAALARAQPLLAPLLDSPNNTLGIAYCRSLLHLGSSMTPLSIRRQGAGHDSAQADAHTASASHLRHLLHTEGLAACAPYMPPPSYALLSESVTRGEAPVLLSALDRALLSHLRRMDASALSRYEDNREGLCNRLADAVHRAPSFEEAVGLAATKRYPAARIRRALLRAYLDFPRMYLDEPPAYLRVLAIGRQGRSLLRTCAQTARLPLITKPLHEKNLPDQTLPRLDAFADELYTLALPSSALHAGGAHYRKTPFCLREDMPR